MFLQDFLEQSLFTQPDLRTVLMSIASASIRIASELDLNKGKIDQVNYTGDTQLAMDVLADVIIHDSLIENEFISIVASEEREDEVILNGDKFAVVYDPLDGSSLIDANFSIGSIFGVYPGTHLLGRKVSDMIAAAYVVYGPRTILVLSFNGATHEFILDECNFVLVRENIKINFEGKYFAPGNLRAYSESVDYKKLIDYWISNKYTLRYSGGMVPDIHHILVKLGGIFAYPGTPENKDGKLRLLYECGPMALIVTNAGGLAVDGYRKILDLVVESLHQKSPIFIGSSREVEKCIK